MRILMNQGLLLRSESAFLYTLNTLRISSTILQSQRNLYGSSIAVIIRSPHRIAQPTKSVGGAPPYKPQLAYVLEFEHSISSKVLSLIKLNRL